MYCENCGTKLRKNDVFCPKCGINLKLKDKKPIVKEETPVAEKVHCPKCQSTNTSVQYITHEKTDGCFSCLLYVFLAITIVGWIILIPLLMRKRTYNTKMRVCNECGYTWKFGTNAVPLNKNQKIALYIIGIILFLIFFFALKSGLENIRASINQ